MWLSWELTGSVVERERGGGGRERKGGRKGGRKEGREGGRGEIFDVVLQQLVMIEERRWPLGNKTQELHGGLGIITTIKWKDTLIAWANDKVPAWWREGGREGGRERREGGREGGREKERERREGGREKEREREGGWEGERERREKQRGGRVVGMRGEGAHC